MSKENSNKPKAKPALSAALRANLAKRKAQARALEATQPKDEGENKEKARAS